MFRNRSVDVHQFAMIPRAEVPRSSFRMQRALKTTFDASYLIPVFCEEILPGDSWDLRMTAFARLATPIQPLMDNMYLESFFFFVPARLLWANWVKFMGEQENPGDSISYAIPQLVSPVSGFAVGSVYDYFGLPTVGQVGVGNTVSVNALPLRAYALIRHEWFRDENLMLGSKPSNGDGPDSNGAYTLWKRAKRHDYFTSCLPWTQKGGIAVSLMTGIATVKPNPTALLSGSQPATQMLANAAGGALPAGYLGHSTGVLTQGTSTSGGAFVVGTNAYFSNLYADLSTATGNTINALRLAFQTQRLLERDARGGTRYTEILRSHFGVMSPDARLQRPEYLGGGSTPVSINPVAQTSATGLTGATTPIGKLAAFGTAVASGHGFRQSFVEHGYVIGLVNVRADLTYQQGLRRMWSRSTRYDFYWPVFAMLGEQAVLNREIYCDGSATDSQVFGYQERWAEYRYLPSQLTGLMRSTSAGTLDVWHVAQRFTGVPTLNSTFIEEDVPIDRVIAVPSEPHFLFDAFFDIKAARPMPMYSVPGLIDHF